jgi:eukaryotic-like serine/threonine-protein kinase
MSVGTTYGKYFLLKRIATGGMGEIYLARQQGPAGFEKILVIKKILQQLSENEKYARSFLSEAKMQAQMNHSSIVQIFDLGQADDGTFYMAMEYVHGKALVDVESKVKRLKERVPPALTAQILERAADALSYAHGMADAKGQSLNIIHRDVSPHNVLISYAGDVKLIDFGIAKSELSTVKTETGTIKGKFYYMSPEQSRAMPLDKRSDVFSLGIVLYECLLGVNPFQKPNVVLSLEAIQKEHPPLPSEVDPDLEPFDAIVARSLAKDRDERYGDADEMRDDLARLRARLPAANERLGAYVSRLFKESLDQDSKILVEMDMGAVRRPATPAPPRSDAAKPLRPSRPSRPLKIAPPDPKVTDSGPGKTILMPGEGGKAAVGVAPDIEPDPVPEHAATVVQSSPFPNQPGRHSQRRAAHVDEAMTIPPSLDLSAYSGSGEEDAPKTDSFEEATDPPRSVSGPWEWGQPNAPERALEPSAPPPSARVVLIAATVIVVAAGAAVIAWTLTHSAPGGALPAIDPGAALADPVTGQGRLRLTTIPPLPVTCNGKAVSGADFPLSGSTGKIEVGDETMALHIKLAYRQAEGSRMMDMNADPGVMVYVNSVARGRTPIFGVAIGGDPIRVEFKKPGVEQTVTLQLQYLGK